MVVIVVEVIDPRDVLGLHLTAVFHVFAQGVDQHIGGGADLAEAHGVVEESAVVIVRGQLVGVEVDQRLFHVRKVELYAGVVGDHQAGFGEDLLIAHVADGGDDLHIRVGRVVVHLCTEDRMQEILDLVAGALGGLDELLVIDQIVVDAVVDRVLEVGVIGTLLALAGGDGHRVVHTPGRGDEDLLLIVVDQSVVASDTGHLDDTGVLVAVGVVVQVLFLILGGDEVHARVIDDTLLRHRAFLHRQSVLQAHGREVAQIADKAALIQTVAVEGEGLGVGDQRDVRVEERHLVLERARLDGMQTVRLHLSVIGGVLVDDIVAGDAVLFVLAVAVQILAAVAALVELVVHQPDALVLVERAGEPVFDTGDERALALHEYARQVFELALEGLARGGVLDDQLTVVADGRHVFVEAPVPALGRRRELRPVMQIGVLQRHAGVLVFGKEAQPLSGAVVVERELQMEGEFFIGADAEILGQRVAVVVLEDDLLAVPLGIELDIVEVEYLTEGAVEQQLAVGVVKYVQTDALSLHTRDDNVVAVEGDVLIALAQMLRHLIEVGIVFEHIEHLGGLFTVAERFVLARVEDDGVVEQVEHLLARFEEQLQLLLAHIALVAVVHVGEESRGYGVHQVVLDESGEGTVAVFEALRQRQEEMLDAVAVPVNVVGWHEVRRVVAQRHEGVEVRLLHRVIGGMILLQTEHHIVEEFELQRGIGRVLPEHLALNEIAVELHLQEIGIVADIRLLIEHEERYVGAADIFVACVNGIDAKTVRRRKAPRLLFAYRIKGVHKVVTAEHVARPRHNGVVGAQVLERDIIGCRLTARAGLFNDARVLISAQLIGGILLGGGVDDQQFDLTGVDASLVLDGIGCFQDQV